MRYNVLDANHTAPVSGASAPEPQTAKPAKPPRKPRITRTAHEQFAGVPDAMLLHLVPGCDPLAVRRLMTDYLRSHPEVKDWRDAVTNCRLPDKPSAPQDAVVVAADFTPAPADKPIQPEADWVRFPDPIPTTPTMVVASTPTKSSYDYLRFL